MDRCPCCNARLSGAMSCPRCQADLGGVIGSEQLAQRCLENAMEYWFADKPQLAIPALAKSIHLKQTASALVFRDFITRQQCRKAMALLANRQRVEAEKLLGLLLELNPDNEFLKQLYAFTEHLLTKDIVEQATRQTLKIIHDLKSR